MEHEIAFAECVEMEPNVLVLFTLCSCGETIRTLARNAGALRVHEDAERAHGIP